MPSILTDKLLPALSWTLFHSLWQGVILTILAGLILLFTKRATPAFRYGLFCSIFFLFLGSALVSFLFEWNAAGIVKEAGSVKAINDQVFNPLPLKQWMQNIAGFLNTNSGWIVAVWLVMFLLKGVKMILDMLYVKRLRNYGSFAPQQAWINRVQELGAMLGIRKKISMVESALVKVPVVIGHFRPLVLVPVGLLTQLPPREVEAVLLHELAHIRRHDYLVNFIQRVAEMLFFFNPGLLWVSSLMRGERENCCDDLAIAKTGDKVGFAEALIRCKEHSMSAQGYALGFLGQKNLLLQRLSRIVYNSNKSLSVFEFAFLIVNFVTGALLLAGMRNPDPSAQPIAALSAIRQSFSVVGADIDQAVKNPVSKIEIDEERVRPSIVNRTPVRRMEQKTTSNFSTVQYKSVEVSLRNELSGTPPLINEKSAEDRIRIAQERDRIEAMRIQILKDRRQADLDREQAMRDREQAIRDREQADRDRAQADKDRAQAEKDRIQADKDREQARRDREKADRDRARHYQ